MADELGTKDRVNRLLEMVVEEVSLVDRAANKHRFLIVKRSDGMDETTSEGAGTETDLNATEAGSVDGADDAEDGVVEGAGGDTMAAANGPLAAAVAALEGLTEAVELLAEAQPASVAPRLSEMAVELQEVAGRLAESLGGPSVGAAGGSAPAPAGAPKQAKAADVPATSEAGSPEPSAKADGVATALATFRAALDRLARNLAPKAAADANPPSPAMSGAQASPAMSGAQASPAMSGAQASPATQAGPTLIDQIGALVGSVQALTGTVQQQQQRLARLEKRSGLPNSQPAGERSTGPAGGGSASWPLDLNRPVDRESVDKAISFHDL